MATPGSIKGIIRQGVLGLKYFLFGLALLCSSLGSVQILSAQPEGSVRKPLPEVSTLVDTMIVMPYVTGSLNLMSGKAFPANATGPGFGLGMSFDLTKEGQPAGFLFDFAFQDMYAVGQNGSCVNPALATLISGVLPDTIQGDLLESATAYHYFTYLLFEPFLKLQGKSDRRGYFLLGASIGMPLLMETYSKSDHYELQTLWNNSPFAHRLRVDLRLGVGVKLGKIGKHDLVLEARAGYPLTPVITNYINQCSGGDVGDWRIITLQANVGLRL
ncbi:MAG: hypothetical protein Q8922_02260 [Bacteroidota bacterium]|nr:hypothetical protein [Bacteroidota bacterium]MDP4232302.1 hypothetical protein [Bacteroidota bacterium]MDP4241441.1 hypothetical protein [Bacteroidota bacterium]MDP4286735.1 hypothetical protein [Bacteroidota bacterium]